MGLPEVASVTTIQERLAEIFPPGTPQRGYCTREIAAKTVFVMLYVGAVEGEEMWVRPNQITRMTDEQALNTAAVERLQWRLESLKPSREAIPGRWYAHDTREPIRDETIREGLIPLGGVVERTGLPTTSSKPRYALQPSFADLFHPKLQGADLESAIFTWQVENLSASALARVHLLREHIVETGEGVLVEFPNRETRRLSSGPSSIISKAVIERFAPTFLAKPGVLFLSESRKKVVARDEILAGRIGLKIRADEDLPDIVLVDVDPATPLLVFVEVVATDGPITVRRKRALLEITKKAGFEPDNVCFLTAYLDRAHPAFKRTAQSLAWGSFVWFASEPHHILYLVDGHDSSSKLLTELLGLD